ncbi:MAG TPA: hypothetical protein VNT32_06140 [Thermoleophilaceae bacterium]|nr:hypothetical protein [Thermoleophilaceae bacterium]
MLDQRLQILLSAEQRRRLEGEAKRQGKSVASLVRAAIDAHYRAGAAGERGRALDAIASMKGAAPSPDELNRLVEAERDAQAP